jgi:hypothetical protein
MKINTGIVALIIIVVGFMVFIFWDNITGDAGKKKGNIISITEDGTQYEEETPGRENYVQSPNTDSSVSEYPVYAYNPREIDPSDLTWNSATKTCPDGTLDCLYYERVENGRVTKITDKDGNDLIEQFVDDLYAGNLASLDELMDNIDWIRLDGEGRLYATDEDGKEEEVIPGEKVPMSMIILVTAVLHKKAGKPKPVFKLDYPAKTQAQLMEMNRQASPGEREFEEPPLGSDAGDDDA